MSNSSRCSHCWVVKDKAEFYKRAASTTGVQNTCKECSNAYARKWSKANPGDRTRRAREYNYAHREAIRTYAAKYHRDNYNIQRRGQTNDDHQ